MRWNSVKLNVQPEFYRTIQPVYEEEKPGDEPRRTSPRRGCYGSCKTIISRTGSAANGSQRRQG